MIKNLYLCTNSSSTKLFLKWRNNMFLSNTSRECTCTYELTDVHHCIKVDFPCGCFGCLFTTSFHSFSTAAFASGINIAWSERSVAHTLGFPRQASLRDGSPELSEPFVTLGFPPGFWELFEEFCPTDTLCRETTQHAPAITLTIWKLGEELSFRSFHWDEFVHQIVTLHRIPSFPAIPIQMNFASDTSAVVILEQRFPEWMFAFPNSSQYVRPYMIWTWCRLNFHQSPPGLVIPFQRSFVQ